MHFFLKERKKEKKEYRGRDGENKSFTKWSHGQSTYWFCTHIFSYKENSLRVMRLYLTPIFPISFMILKLYMSFKSKPQSIPCTGKYLNLEFATLWTSQTNKPMVHPTHLCALHHVSLSGSSAHSQSAIEGEYSKKNKILIWLISRKKSLNFRSS